MSKLLTITEKQRLLVNGIIHKISTSTIKKGDRVIDRKDGCHGICTAITNHNTITIEEGNTAELGVPLKRVYKLIPIVISPYVFPGISK